MTVTDVATEGSTSGETQVLFREAKQRRRRRWLVSGITIGVAAIVLILTIGLTSGRGGNGRSPADANPATITVAAHNGFDFSLRPVLCYAPALNLSVGETPSAGPLPECAPASRLTAANLFVNTDTGQATVTPPQDPQFATYPATPASGADDRSTVLLPGSPSAGSGRFVLGPAGMTRSGVESARALLVGDGQWVVELDLNGVGATQWNALAQLQFHAIVGVVYEGRVVSAPLTQPSQSEFSSFHNQLQVSGDFTKQEAETFAAAL